MIETVAAVNLMVEEVLKIKKNRLMPDFPKGNDYEDALTGNQAVEKMISDALPQYMWLHRRFKTTPDGSDRYHNI